MATEAKLVIERQPADPNKPSGRFAAAAAHNKAAAEEIKARRKKIHDQSALDAGGSAPEAKDGVPLPEREDIESIEITLRDGRVVEYGPPTGISLSDRIARLFSSRSAAEGGPDPGITEYRLTRLLMGVRAIDGKPVSFGNLIERTKLANRLGDEAIDLINLFDNRYWPPLRESELPLVKKNLRQSGI